MKYEIPHDNKYETTAPRDKMVKEMVGAASGAAVIGLGLNKVVCTGPEQEVSHNGTLFALYSTNGTKNTTSTIAKAIFHFFGFKNSFKSIASLTRVENIILAFFVRQFRAQNRLAFKPESAQSIKF